MKKCFAALLVLLPCALFAADSPALAFSDPKIELPPLSLIENVRYARESSPLAGMIQSYDPRPAPSFPEKSISYITVIAPKPGVDYKLTIKAPDPSVDYKLIVKASNGRTAGEVRK